MIFCTISICLPRTYNENKDDDDKNNLLDIFSFFHLLKPSHPMWMRMRIYSLTTHFFHGNRYNNDNQTYKYYIQNKAHNLNIFIYTLTSCIVLISRHLTVILNLFFFHECPNIVSDWKRNHNVPHYRCFERYTIK